MDTACVSKLTEHLLTQHNSLETHVNNAFLSPAERVLWQGHATICSLSGNIRVASSLEALHMNKVAVNIFVQVLSKETGIFTSGFYTMNEMLTEARQGVQ